MEVQLLVVEAVHKLIRSGGEEPRVTVRLEALLSHPVFEGKMLDQVEGLLGESSSWFLLRAEAELGERRSRLNSVLNRNDERVLVIARSPAPAFRGRLTEDDKG